MQQHSFDYFKESSYIQLQLGNHAVHIHQLQLPQTNATEAGRKILSAEENIRAQKYFSQEDAFRYTHAQLFKRHILAHYSKTAAGHLQFGNETNYGKPQLKTNRNIHFNLAYRGSYAIIAIANREVGVDIEKEIVIQNLEAFAKNFFSQTERAWLLDAQNINTRKTNFFRLWTLKEAFIKALGKGLSYPLQDFTIQPNETEIGLYLPIEYNTEFALAEITTAAGYAAAVCLSHK